MRARRCINFFFHISRFVPDRPKQSNATHVYTRRFVRRFQLYTHHFASTSSGACRSANEIPSTLFRSASSATFFSRRSTSIAPRLFCNISQCGNFKCKHLQCSRNRNVNVGVKHMIWIITMIWIICKLRLAYYLPMIKVKRKKTENPVPPSPASNPGQLYTVKKVTCCKSILSAERTRYKYTFQIWRRELDWDASYPSCLENCEVVCDDRKIRREQHK